MGPDGAQGDGQEPESQEMPAVGGISNEDQVIQSDVPEKDADPVKGATPVIDVEGIGDVFDAMEGEEAGVSKQRLTGKVSPHPAVPDFDASPEKNAAQGIPIPEGAPGEEGNPDDENSGAAEAAKGSESARLDYEAGAFFLGNPEDETPEGQENEKLRGSPTQRIVRPKTTRIRVKEIGADLPDKGADAYVTSEDDQIPIPDAPVDTGANTINVPPPETSESSPELTIKESREEREEHAKARANSSEPPRLSDTLDLVVGEMVHGFEILANPKEDATAVYVGEGANGVIYRARHVGLNRLVALKFLKKVDASLEELAQFQKEATSIANLSGNNILQVYDFSVWNEHTFMAMELLEGGSLKDRFEEQSTGSSSAGSSGLRTRITNLFKAKKEELSVKPKVYKISRKDIEYYVGTIMQVAQQLEVAHKHGILHRDIKPDNIMFRDKTQKEAVLVDYGLAALLKTEQAEESILAGTPQFMSPEQTGRAGDVIDARTDVFGLGATLYKLLTGIHVHTFEGTKKFEQRIEIIRRASPIDIRLVNKKIDKNLAAIVHKAIAKIPDDRYKSAQAFYEDLKQWQEGKWVKARPAASFFLPTTRRVQKRGLSWLGAATAAGVLGGIVVGSIYTAKEPERQRDARIVDYIAQVTSFSSGADAQRKTANNAYEQLSRQSLIAMMNTRVESATIAEHQKMIARVFGQYSDALKVAEAWKNEKKEDAEAEQQRSRLELLAKEFEKKNEYAVKKVSAYEQILEFRTAYENKEFAKAEKALASALDRLYEQDTQIELARVKEEDNQYQKQRTMQGVRDIAERVRAYGQVCRACFMDDIKVFSGSEKDIEPGKGVEWKRLITGIEEKLKTPDDAILQKIPLDEKTYADLMEGASADAKAVFYSEKGILNNPDVRRAVEMKRNSAAENVYVTELRDRFVSGKIDDEEYRVRMKLPLPSEREKFTEALEIGFKKGDISKDLYEKLKEEK